MPCSFAILLVFEESFDYHFLHRYLTSMKVEVLLFLHNIKLQSLTQYLGCNRLKAY
jgi:hypothetical protein